MDARTKGRLLFALGLLCGCSWPAPVLSKGRSLLSRSTRGVAWRGYCALPVRSLPVFVSAVAAQQFSFPLIAAAAEALPELPAQRLPGSGVEPQPVQGWPLRCAAAGAQPEQQAGCFPLSADEAK